MRQRKRELHSNNTLKNILYVMYYFPKISETFILDQIVFLIDRGYDLTILAHQSTDESIAHTDVAKYNLLDRTIYIKRNNSPLGFTLNSRIIDTLFNCDVIHAHFSKWPAETALKLSDLTGIPFIVTAHAFDLYYNLDRVKIRKIFAQAQRVITVSDYNKKFIRNIVGNDSEDKVEVVRCGVSLGTFNKSRKKNKDINEKIIMLTIGRFVEKKGLPYSLRAFALLCKQHKNIEYRIIGDGPMRAEILKIIKMLGIRDKVRMLGQLPREAVLEELSRADIFVLSSITAANGDREGLPVSILEAQAMNLPVVSTIHTGIPEALENGISGFLVPEKNIDALVEKLDTLITNENLRVKMGINGRKNVENHFNQREEMKSLEGIMQMVSTFAPRMSDRQNQTVKRMITMLSTQSHTAISEKNKIIMKKDEKNKYLKKKNQELQTFVNRVKDSTPYKLYSTLVKPFLNSVRRTHNEST